MKRNMRTVCALLLILLLAACGNASAPEANQDAGSVKRGVSSGTDAESVAAGFDASYVENNGGAYVRAGGKVYFRKYGPDALATSFMLGEWNLTGGASEIVAYDPATGETETLFTESGYGGFYVGDGGFYLQERIDGEDYVVWYSPDGEESRTIGKGTLLGLSDGGLLAVQYSPGVTDDFYLYRDGQEAGSFHSEGSFLYVGLSDDGLFLLGMDDSDPYADTAEYTLWQLLPETDGEVICLGTLPETDYKFDAEPEQFVVSENQIGVVVGYYAGTGHFLNDVAVLTAIPGEEDSLETMDFETPELADGEEFIPKLTVDGDGEILTVTHLYGDMQIGWHDEDDGDLQFYNGVEWVTLKENLIPYREDGSGYRKIAQSMEYVDGAAYVTFAAAYASPLDDIGWRDAYSLLDMLYVSIGETERELAAVEYETVLQGNVWFQEGEESLLWQQTDFSPDAWPNEAESAFLIPISPDAVWDDQDAILSNAAWAELSGEANYDGYPLPDEDGQLLYLRLNRDGEVVYLTQESPDALPSMDDGVEEEELADTVEAGIGLEGEWLYRDPDTGTHTARLLFDDDGALTVSLDDASYPLKWTTARFYARDNESPDLLRLEADATETMEAINMQGEAGDYHFELFRTDGETILYLSQVNNGDAALDGLIPHDEDDFLTDIVLHRYEGVAASAGPLWDATLTAGVVKADEEQNKIWLQAAEARYDEDYEKLIYIADTDEPCVCYSVSSKKLFRAFKDCLDPEYPMMVFQVTIDSDGRVTALDVPPDMDEPKG